MSKIKSLFSNINFICKLVEWILCLATSIFLADAHTSFYDLRARDLVVVAAPGFFVITLALFVIYIMDKTHELYELITMLAGAILNLVGGVMCFIHFVDDSKRTNTLIVAILMIACGAIMLADWILMFKKKK
ncbi:hypothetical protein Trydic_g352 [Trypoxylus dichotomus]